MKITFFKTNGDNIIVAHFNILISCNHAGFQAGTDKKVGKK